MHYSDIATAVTILMKTIIDTQKCYSSYSIGVYQSCIYNFHKQSPTIIWVGLNPASPIHSNITVHCLIKPGAHRPQAGVRLVS